MVSDISSKSLGSAGGATGRPSVAPAAANGSAAPAPAEAKSYITPIPKADIKIDFERESQNLRDAIGKLNDMLTSTARNVSFAMDEKLGRPIVYVKNATTGEVVRQIPNEVVVRIAHSIEDLKGLLHNEKI